MIHLTSNPTRPVDGFLDNMAVHQPSLSDFVVSGTSVYLDIEAVDGGNIDIYLDGVLHTLDCTTGDGVDGKARVEIAQGTATEDKASVVYAIWSEQESKIVLVNGEEYPQGAFCPMAYVSINDYTYVTSYGGMVKQRVTEAISHNEQGAISRMRENTRLVRGGGWWSGVDPELTITTNGVALDDINLGVTNGLVYQMNRQVFPAIDLLTDAFTIIGSDGAGTLDNFEEINDLNEIVELRDGTTLVDGDIVILDVYGLVNYSEAECKVCVFPSKKKYTDADFAIQVAEGSRFTRIPNNHRTVGFPIVRLVLKYETAASGTWTNVLTAAQLVWKPGTQTISTPNYPSNYGNNYSGNLGSDITEGTALKIRATFDAFHTETNYDFIRIRNASDTTFGTYHGNLGAFTTVEVPGTTLRVHFTSDGSVTKRGCQILAYEYQVNDASGGEWIDMR